MNSVVEVLKTRGWSKGRSRGPDGSVCLGRAMLETRHCFFEYMDRIVSEYCGYSTGVVGFNDAPGTTLEDIMTVAGKYDAEYGLF